MQITAGLFSAGYSPDRTVLDLAAGPQRQDAEPVASFPTCPVGQRHLRELEPQPLLSDFLRLDSRLQVVRRAPQPCREPGKHVAFGRAPPRFDQRYVAGRNHVAREVSLAEPALDP